MSHLSSLQVAREAEKAKRMGERKDYYAALGLGRDASDREIKQAYRDRARLYHPDKASAAGLSKEDAENRFRDVAEAYEVMNRASSLLCRCRPEFDMPQVPGAVLWHRHLHAGSPSYLRGVQAS